MLVVAVVLGVVVVVSCEFKPKTSEL